MSSNDSSSRKTLSLKPRTDVVKTRRDQDAPTQRSGSRARVVKERLRAQNEDKSENSSSPSPRGRGDKPYAPRERTGGGEFNRDRGSFSGSRDRADKPYAPRERSGGGEFNRDRGSFSGSRDRGDRPYAPRERTGGGEFNRDRGSFSGSRDRADKPYAPRERTGGGEFNRDRGSFSGSRDRADKPYAPRERTGGGEFNRDRGSFSGSRDRGDKPYAPRERTGGGEFNRDRGSFSGSRDRGDKPYAPRERSGGGEFNRDRGSFSGSRDRADKPYAPRERSGGGEFNRDRGSFSGSRDRGDKPYTPRERTGGGEFNRDRGSFSGSRDRGDKPYAPRERSGGESRPQFRPRAEDAVVVPRLEEIFHVFASCPQGLEAALEAELQALEFSNVRQGRAGCHFDADWRGVMRANLYSRLATRVLVRLAQGPVHTEDDILALAQETAWERWFGPEHRLRVDTSAIRSPMQSLQYCNLRVKDGICDRLRDREGARPDIDTVRPDARVHLFLTEDTATLYLDTSGESLFKRGWRFDKGRSPLRENLAAGLLALSGWDPEAALLDPFCGSGTILIEAAWIALGVPPGMSRPFGFERMRDYDPYILSQLRQEAQDAIRPALDAPLIGVDLDPAVIEAARSNAERARLGPDTLRFEVGDARTFPAPAERGWIVTNPPYGERLDEHEDTLWADWASHLKHNYAGWSLNAISNDMALPQALRLKAARRQPVFNGSLECRLFSFDLVAGSNRE